MHELSIALSLLDQVAEEAERRGGVQVHAIHLRLGPLSGVVKEALLSAYELVLKTPHSHRPSWSSKKHPFWPIARPVAHEDRRFRAAALL